MAQETAVDDNVDDVEVVKPSIEELAKPSETNLICHFTSCEGKTFKHRPALNMHLTELHGVKGLGDFHSPKNQKKSKVFICPVDKCKRNDASSAFHSMKYLKQHYKCMHAERTHLCTNCNKKFVAEVDLTQHKKSCGKTFVCSLCKSPFTTIERLKIHQRSQHHSAYRVAQQLLQNAKDAQHTKEKAEVRSSTVQVNKPSTVIGLLILDEKNHSPKANHILQKNSSDSHTLANKLPSLRPKTLLPISSSNTSVGTMTAVEDKLDEIVARESCGTQTDVLKEAVLACDIQLPTTSRKNTSEAAMQTANVTQRNLPRKRRATRSPAANKATKTHIIDNAQMMKATNLYANSTYYPPSITDQRFYDQSWSTPSLYFPALPSATQVQTFGASEFGTQTSTNTFEEQSTLRTNIDFGTQTAISLSLTDIEQNSIELQCELGPNPYQYSDHMASFGTQTPYGNVNNYPLQSSSQTDVSSFGTQTAAYNANDFDLDNLGITPQVHQSTSDFAMQFSFEFAEFGTQTSTQSEMSDFPSIHLPFVDTSDYTHDSQDITSLVTHSQSSTQTDLEYLLKNIDTQT